MAKIRIFELAKELGIESKELIGFLNDNKIEVKNHMSALEDDTVGKVRRHFTKEEKPAAPDKASEAE